ncbi:MAG: hypothetical protein U0Q03_24300 [Acidimicrobiales bacterium]
MTSNRVPRSLAPLLVAALALAACGGSDDAGTQPPATGQPPATSPTTVEPAPVGTAAGSSVPPGTAAPAPSGGATAVDPAASDPCSILSVEEVSAAVGDTASDPIDYHPGSTEVAECTWFLDSGASLGFQIELVVVPGSQSVTNGRPFDVGSGGQISDGDGYPFAMTDINGWLVKLTGLSGVVTEEQLAAIGRLLETRLIDRDASSAAASPTGPTGPTGDGSGEGTCSVQVTGAIQDSFTSGQNIGEALADVWVPDDQEAMADSMFPGPNGAPDFQVGCSSDTGASVLIMLYDVDVPLGATSVPVPDNQAGYFSDQGLVGNRGDAEIVLTRFDESGMTGSITFTGDGLGTGESTVTMTFDFTNDWAN